MSPVRNARRHQRILASVNGEGTTSDDAGAAPKPPDTSTAAVKQSGLTAREKLRAARVLSKYTDSKAAAAGVAAPPRRPAEFGSKVLEAMRETDGGKKRSGLPEAPSNMLDDSQRGLSKGGFSFDFPGRNDVLLIIFSFVFISSVMFATTFVVWKLGAIHFNEY